MKNLSFGQQSYALQTERIKGFISRILESRGDQNLGGDIKISKATAMLRHSFVENYSKIRLLMTS